MDNLARLWQTLRARKIVQWALAYLGAAWFLVQLFGELAGTWGWSAVGLQALQVAVLMGLPVVLVIAWYHGEKGRQRVSGPELLMVGVLLAVAGTAVGAVLTDDSRQLDVPATPTGRLEPDIRLAVLPLQAGPSEDDQWLASGLRAELINEFASVPSLVVVGRSGFGEQLHVDYLIEGQIRRAGTAVRLSMRLVSAEDQSVLHTVAEDRVLDMDSLFMFQAQAARRVVGVIGGRLRAVQSALGNRIAPDPEAFRLFLQSQGSSTLSEVRRRERLLLRALQLDPTFVAAAASLVRVSNWMVWNFSSEIPDAPSRARAALDRLRSLGADDVSTLRAEAEYAYRVEGDLPRALDLLETIVQRDPGDAAALMMSGAILRRMGRWDDAVARMSQGFDVDPYGGIAWNLGETHQMLRDWPEAERYHRHAVAVDPNNPFYQSSFAFLPIRANGDTASSRRYLESLDESMRQEIQGTLLHFTGRLAEEAERLRARPPAGTGSSVGKARRLARLGVLAHLNGERRKAEVWSDSLLSFLGSVEWSPRPLTQADVRSLQGLAFALRGERTAALQEGAEAIAAYPPSQDAYHAGTILEVHAQILLLTGDTLGAAQAVSELLTVPSDLSPWSVRLSPLWAAVVDVEPLASLLPPR